MCRVYSMRRYIAKVSLIIICSLVLFLALSIGIYAEESNKDILIILSEYQKYNKTKAYGDYIREELLDMSDGNVNIFTESLDEIRLEGCMSKEIFNGYLLDKYQIVNFGGVICVGEAAYNIMKESDSNYYSKLPMLYMDIDNKFIKETDGKDFIGVELEMPFEYLFSTMSALDPSMTKINIYTNPSVDLTIYEEDLKVFSNYYDIRYQIYSDMKAEEYVKNMVDTTIGEGVIVLSSIYKKTGEIFDMESIFKYIGKQDETMIFTISDRYVGSGATGSVDYDNVEYVVATLGLLGDRLWESEGNDRKIATDLEPRIIVDYNKIKSLGLKDNKINRDVIYINKPTILELIYNYEQEFVILILVIIGMILIRVISKILRHIRIGKVHEQTRNELEISYLELEKANKLLVENRNGLAQQYTELQEKEEDLRVSRERYRLAATGAEFGIWDYDFFDNKLYFSKKCKEILDVKSKEAYFHIEDLYRVFNREEAEIRSIVMEHLKGRSKVLEYTGIVDIRNKQEWISIRGKVLFDEDENPTRLAGSLMNVTREKRATEEIRQVAFYDEMTGLYNRAYFNGRIETLISKDDKIRVAILILDLDNFKNINDSMGHRYGDNILKKVGQRLREHVEDRYDVIRSSGDEFIILLEAYENIDEIDELAESIVMLFRQKGDIEFLTTISIGIAIVTEGSTGLETLLKHADLALNEVKKHGRNQYMYYDKKVEYELEKRLGYEKRLVEALDKKEFRLYYQPKVNIKNNTIVGYESVIRWHHPEKGVISPDEFIPIAEEKGIIIDIGEWVIKEAINQLEAWYEVGHTYLTMSINLSAKQFQEVGLLSIIDKAMIGKNIKPYQIEFEITETTAIHDIDYAIGQLEVLREKGFKIALDDFGTGYSSLNYLSLLPVDTLKIDKIFVSRSMANDSSKQVIRAVIQLAHAHEMEIIAEGVETLEQLIFLRKEECDVIQGYYVSQPVEANAAIDLVNRFLLDTLQIEGLWL